MYSISIIIPIYNVEKYIERCLMSVMRQTNFEGFVECILVDDFTPDKSMLIAQNLIDEYKGTIHFRIIHNRENQGLSCSRNNGLMIAKGDYVFFLDSDDYISDNCLQCLSRELYRYDCVIDMVIGNSYYVRNDKFWQDRNGVPYLLQDHTDIMRRFLQFETPMMAWNKLVRRQFLLENNLLFAPRMLHEDELWSFELYDIVRSVVLIPDVTYSYEQNVNSIMTSTSNLNRRAEAYQTLVQKMLASLKQKDLYVERFFWGIHMYMFFEDMFFNQGLSSSHEKKDRKLSGLMFRKSLADCRWIISIFLLLTIMPPFNQLVRVGWFRCNYHRITSVFKRLALKCDSIHRMF